MNKNLDNLIKKFEESCNDTEILNDSLKNMNEVIGKYNNTLISLNKNNKLKEVVDFGKNIEERIESIKAYNNKELLKEYKVEMDKLEERLKKHIKVQVDNKNKVNNTTGTKDLENKISKILINQDNILDVVKSVRNEEKIEKMEEQLKKANLIINSLKVELSKKERYYENRMSKIEEELFSLKDKFSYLASLEDLGDLGDLTEDGLEEEMLF